MVMSLTDKILALIFLSLILGGIGIFLVWQIFAALDRFGYRRRWYAGFKRAEARTAELGPDANKCIIRKELL